MYCPSCGSPLPLGAKFCLHCGALSRAYEPSSPGPTAISYPNGPQSGSSLSYDPKLKMTPSSTPLQMPAIAYGSTPHTPPPTSYVAPEAGSQPSYPPPLIPADPKGQKSPRRFSAGLTTLFIVLSMLLIAGSGLIYYTAIYQPGIQHTQATATTMAHLTGTAQALATTQAQINATATAVAENPYTHKGTLALFDPLNDNSKGYDWAHDPINCGFKDGAYHVKAPNPHYADYCLANVTDFSDFAFEVQMQIIKGGSGGIVFRYESTATTLKFYEWFVGQDGSYYLYVVVDTKNGISGKLLAGGINAAIKQGLNQSNLIAVVAQGSNIALYVNHQIIANSTDSTYNHGRIGTIVSALGNLDHPTEVVFSNAKVWTL